MPPCISAARLFLSFLNYTVPMENLPGYIKAVFALTTFLTIFFFYRATQKSTLTLGILFTWLVFQGFMGFSGFYMVTDSIPPRFLLLVGPPLLFIIGLFLTSSGKTFLDSLDLKSLTILHTIRIPVEIVLFWLCLHQGVPELMTFEGRNFDLISGITAPLIYYFGFVKHQLNTKILILWNCICLGLLINIVSNAALSVPSVFQKFAFDQPNIAILYFPFIWLPCCVVPLVLLSHLVTLRQLRRKSKQEFLALREYRVKYRGSIWIFLSVYSLSALCA
jgi:hypothetical protein